MKQKTALVYYAVGGEQGYAVLLFESLASLRRHHPAPGFRSGGGAQWAVDVAVLCDAAYAAHLRDGLEQLGARAVHTPPNGTDVQLVSARKLETHLLETPLPETRFAPLASYDAVLYLDCDTLVLGALDPLFDAVAAGPSDRLHVCREAGPEGHAHTPELPYWSIEGALHSRELEALLQQDTGVFNCGQFAFRPTPAMAEHFVRARALMREVPGGFWEQSYANHHFAAKARATHEAVLTPLVHLAAREAPAPAGTLIAHFSAAGTFWERKLGAMRAWPRD